MEHKEFISVCFHFPTKTNFKLSTMLWEWYSLQGRCRCFLLIAVVHGLGIRRRGHGTSVRLDPPSTPGDSRGVCLRGPSRGILLVLGAWDCLRILWVSHWTDWLRGRRLEVVCRHLSLRLTPLNHCSRRKCSFLANAINAHNNRHNSKHYYANHNCYDDPDADCSSSFRLVRCIVPMFVKLIIIPVIR